LNTSDSGKLAIQYNNHNYQIQKTSNKLRVPNKRRLKTELSDNQS